MPADKSAEKKSNSSNKSKNESGQYPRETWNLYEVSYKWILFSAFWATNEQEIIGTPKVLTYKMAGNKSRRERFWALSLWPGVRNLYCIAQFVCVSVEPKEINRFRTFYICRTELQMKNRIFFSLRIVRACFESSVIRCWNMSKWLSFHSTGSCWQSNIFRDVYHKLWVKKCNFM